jgi:hypothetical protein
VAAGCGWPRPRRRGATAAAAASIFSIPWHNL